MDAPELAQQALSEQPNFSDIPLEMSPSKKKKVPRRILHFSDGTLEEYSTDEDEEIVKPENKVDPKTLSWMPWIWYYMALVGKGSFSGAELCGEKLAWFFGITSPKYQYAIDEYYRLKEEEEEDKRLEESIAIVGGKKNDIESGNMDSGDKNVEKF